MKVRMSLLDDYNNLFYKGLNQIYNKTQFYPLAIWQTNRSNIALIAYTGSIFDCTHYQIIAEPRK